MPLTATETRNRDRVLALYRDVLDPRPDPAARIPGGGLHPSTVPRRRTASTVSATTSDWIKATHPAHRNHIKRIFAQDAT